jgi:hypothetical protein
MTDAPADQFADSPADGPWPRRCPECGTELQSATIDLDDTKADRPELRPGEMAAVDFCPNPDCPSHRRDTAAEV